MMLNRLIWVYIAYLLISATFARKVLKCLTALLGPRTVQGIPWSLLTGALILLMLLMMQRKLPYTHLFTALLTFTGIFFFLKMMRNPNERIHIFQYGLLGFLVALDKRRGSMKRTLLFALLIAFLVSCADELFQFFLPYRVGDLRDVGFGLIGGAWGALLAVLIAPRNGREAGKIKNDEC